MGEGHPFSSDHGGCIVVRVSGKGPPVCGEAIHRSEPIRGQKAWCETDCLHGC